MQLPVSKCQSTLIDTDSGPRQVFSFRDPIQFVNCQRHTWGGGRRERGRDMEQERCPSLPLLAKLLSLTPTPTQIPVEVPLIGKALNQQTKALPTLIWCVSIALEQVGRGALLPFLLSPPPFPSSSPSPYCYNSFFRSPTFYHHLLQCLTLM